jgi:hypothetical protein
MAGLDKLFGVEYDHTTPGQMAGEANTVTGAEAPQLQATINQLKKLAAQGDIDAAKLLSMGFNDIALGELARTAPQISAIQGQLDAGQAGADVANLNRFGVPAAQAMRTTDEAANKEFYQNLGTVGDKYATALADLSPNMSAGQRAEMERGMARMNPNMADNSAINVAEKASEFGSAGAAQQQRFVDAINSISASLPNLKTGLNPTALALGRDSRTAPVAGAVTPVTKPTTEGTDTGRGLFSGILGNAADINKMKAGAFKGWGDAFAQDAQSVGNLAGAFGGG